MSDRASDHNPPVGLSEIADRMGVKRSAVDHWRLQGLLPKPKWTVGGRPAWAWRDIEQWAEETGRAYAVHNHRTDRDSGPWTNVDDAIAHAQATGDRCTVVRLRPERIGSGYEVITEVDGPT